MSFSLHLRLRNFGDMSKYNKLYHALLTDKWSVHPALISKYTSVLDTFLNRAPMAFEKDDDKEEEASIISFFDQEGEPIRTSYGEVPNRSCVASVEVIGSILKYSSWSTYGADYLTGTIRSLIDNPNVKGVVMQIDSGGGAVSAMGPWTELLTKADKPIVSLCDSCYSAAYWIAAHSDYIIADNNISSGFGSIGVMLEFADIRGYYEKEGAKIHTIYSNLSSYKNKEYEEALKGNYELIKSQSLDPLAKKFQDAVIFQRQGKINTQIEGIIEGATFYAEDSLQYGLIDEIGTMADAIAAVNRIASDGTKAAFRSIV